jgi:hypothetical protein
MINVFAGVKISNPAGVPSPELIPIAGVGRAIKPNTPNIWLNEPKEPDLSKLLAIIVIGLMILHLIKPLNWPGLRKRADFWKIAVILGVAIVVTAALRR